MTMPIANANVTASCQLVISPLQAAHPEATSLVCLRQGAPRGGPTWHSAAGSQSCMLALLDPPGTVVLDPARSSKFPPGSSNATVLQTQAARPAIAEQPV